MMRWGYKTVLFEMKKEGLLGGAFLDETEIEQELNEFGRSGWELVSILEMQDGIIAFFKQPLGIKPVAGRYRGEDSDESTAVLEEAERIAVAAPVDVEPAPAAVKQPAPTAIPRSETNTIGAIKIE